MPAEPGGKSLAAVEKAIGKTGYERHIRAMTGYAFQWIARAGLVMAVLAAAVLPAAAQSDGGPSALRHLVGEKRLVLLFSPSKSDAVLDKQLGMFAERRPGIRDRDLAVLVTAGNRETSAAIGYASLRSGTAIGLRRHYEPARQGLTVILVGKDGAEKGRWQGAQDPQLLFDLIDATPERQEELNGRGLTN